MKAADLAPGDVFAGYRIQSPLGEGGMGMVFVAEHLGLHRKVALKLLPDQLAADPRFRERFVRESQLAASLDHPNVVPVYEAGEAEGRLFIAMRYVEGIDLRALLDQEVKLDPSRTIRILAQVASALDAAHELGLVHRDVKPSNILLARRAGSGSKPGAPEHVYLSDFGLTKRTTSKSGITGTGQFVGTLDYAAPEQFEGKDLTAATDVYSLGCVLFECLTGKVPYPRPQDAAVMYAHLMAPPPSVSAESPDLPKQIDEVVSKALAKAPEGRYESAGALVDAAADALGVHVGTQTPPTRHEPSSAPRRSRVPLVLLAAGALLAIVAIMAVVLSKGGGPAAPASPRSTVALQSFLARVNPVSGKVTRIRVGKHPTAVLVAEGSVWVANSGANTVSRVDPVTGGVAATIQVGIDPQGIIAAEGSLWVANVASVSRIDPASNRIVATIPIWAKNNVSDRRSLAAGEGWIWAGTGLSIAKIDPGTNRVVRTVDTNLSNHGGGAQSIAAGGGSVWLAGDAGDLLRIDPANLLVERTIQLGKEVMVISLEGQTLWVAADGTPGTLFKLDARTGRVEETIPAGGGYTYVAPPRPIYEVSTPEGVWITDTVAGTISHVSALSGDVSLPISVGKIPKGIAIGLGSVWVTVDGG